MIIAMKPLMLADCHSHSVNSFDGNDSVSDMYDSAAERGAAALCVTDHFETACFDQPDLCDVERIKKSVDDVLAQRKKGGNMLILRGVELGQPTSDLAHAETVFNAAEYDIVLGSVHILTGGEDFYYINYKQTNAADVYAKYLDQLLCTLEWGRFDVLAHLTYPRRYMLRDGSLPDLSLFKSKTSEILSLAVQKGIAIEVNTNAKTEHNYLLGEYLDILKTYRKLGGKLITFGSDAHRAKDVANGLELARELALAAGFDRAYYYAERQPVEYRI